MVDDGTRNDRAESFNADYPKGEKGYVIYSLGYNEGEQGKGRKSPESFVSMIAKFNDIENSHMLSDDDDSYTIYTIGYFDGESDKINKRTPQAFELMLSKMGKSYGKPLLSSIPKTARLDAESKKNCGCGQDPCKTYGAEQRTCKLCGNKGHNARTCKYNKIDFSQGGFWKTREPDANFMPRWGEKLTKAERKKRETKAMKNATELDFPYVDNSYAVMITKIVDGFPMKGNRRINVPRLELPDTMKMYEAENSYCHNHKTCGGYRVQGTFLCWPCHDIEADIRIAKRNDAESFEATKGIDTFTEPFEEIGVPKWLIGIGGVVAAITGINYLSKKL